MSTTQEVIYNWLLEETVGLDLAHLIPLTLWAQDMNCDFNCNLSRFQVLSLPTNGDYILILNNLFELQDSIPQDR